MAICEVGKCIDIGHSSTVSVSGHLKGQFGVVSGLFLKHDQRSGSVSQNVRIRCWLARRDRLTEERDIAIVGVNLVAQPAMDHDAVLPTAIGMVGQSYLRAGFKISIHEHGVAHKSKVCNGSRIESHLRLGSGQ